jgi:hypothetical protein
MSDSETGVWIADTYISPPIIRLKRSAGTCLSVPSWAGLIVVVNQGRVGAGEATLNKRRPENKTQQAVYSLPQADFNVITSGTNNGYTAQAGYNS